MLTDFKKKLDLGLPDDESTIDLDEIAGKLDGMNSELETYRASIVRHINARRDLLGEAGPLNNTQTNIQQLLDIKDKLDQEFRERFRISASILPQPGSTENSPGRSRFYTSGR
ncbi:MAG: hypothetical protein H8E46_10920 [FCB group bacterium]|nr:hypothetical protein [FCB group bacterium]